MSSVYPPNTHSRSHAVPVPQFLESLTHGTEHFFLRPCLAFLHRVGYKVFWYVDLRIRGCSAYTARRRKRECDLTHTKHCREDNDGPNRVSKQGHVRRRCT